MPGQLVKSVSFEQHYRSLVSKNNQLDALRPLGTLLLQSGRIEEGIAFLQRSVEYNPNDAETLSNLGVGLRRINRPHDAIVALKKATLIRHDSISAHINLGNSYCDIKDFSSAAASFENAYRLDPSDFGVRRSLAHALYLMGDVQKSEQVYRALMVEHPRSVDCLRGLVAALLELKRAQEAVSLISDFADQNPQSSDLSAIYAVALAAVGRRREARDHYKRSLNFNADNAEIYCNLANLDKEDGDLEAAEAGYRKAIAIKPEFALAHRNLGMLLLSMERYAEGWSEYEWRSEGRDPNLPNTSSWDGSALPDKVLLICAEQGLGDTIQFCRYLPTIGQLCDRIVFRVQSPLIPLLESMGLKNVEFLAHDGPLPHFDRWTRLMSLPFLLNTNSVNIPHQIPYLHPEPQRTAFWQGKLRASPLTVGINWQGAPGADIDRGRSIPLREFTPLAALPGVQLMSLQQSHGVEQLLLLRDEMRITTLGNPIDTPSAAFVETLAVMANLDLIITSDTAIAHLAGAAGHPVWLLLKQKPDWRWLLAGETSAWYPSMRLFRQARAGDWSNVFDQVSQALQDLLMRRNGVE